MSIIKRAKIKDQWRNSLLSVENLIPFDRTVMVYRIVNKFCSESLGDIYQQRDDLSNYKTRNSGYHHITKVNLKHRKKGFQYSGIKNLE